MNIEWFWKWKLEHPTAYKRVLFVALGVVIAVAGMAWWKLARGAAVTMTCPTPPSVSGNVATCSVADSGTTTPPTGGGTTPPPPPPVSEFAGCAPGSMTSKTFFPQPSGNGSTVDLGLFVPGKVLSFRMAIPASATNANGELKFMGTYGGSPSGVWAISESACDFGAPVQDTTKVKNGVVQPKPISGYVNGSLQTYYPVGVGKGLVPGKTYYLNIRIDGCSIGASGGCWFENIRFT